MSTQYRYLSSDLISGQVNADWLPLTVTSFGRVLNGPGQFDGSLNLTAGTSAEGRTWRDALEPRRSVLWCFMDGVPVWNGIVWDWNPESAGDGMLPVAASTMDSLFSHRYITDPRVFQSQDVFSIFRSLASYALSKGPNSGVARLNLGSNPSGVPATISYAAEDQQQVLAAWTDLAAAYQFEYAFRPAIASNGTLATYLDLGQPTLGLLYPASRLAYSYPGDLLDYQFTRTGSSSANAILGTAPNTTIKDADTTNGENPVFTSTYPHGYDLTDLGAGYPLLEQPATLEAVTVTSAAQVDAYADGVLPSVTGTQLLPLLTLGNDQGPAVKDIVLGSWCQVALTSALHPARAGGSPGFQAIGRITGWTVNPPAPGQGESTLIQTWMPGDILDIQR